MRSVGVVAIFITLAIFIPSVRMAYSDVVQFFNLKNNNLTSITWAHAVNNKTLLEESLKSNVMMLEADVSIGNLTSGNTSNIPIMAHPPNTISDLSLEEFMTQVLDFNRNASTAQVKKGIKLDFKSIEALEASDELITRLYANMSYPVWINADIKPGPLNATTLPVNADRFFNVTRKYPNSTLSIGWTTNYSSNMNATSYSNEQIGDMLTTIKANNVNQYITFPVRAGIAAESLAQMKVLLTNTSGSTLTIWSSEGDPVNVTNLRQLVREAGLEKTFIDVPADLQAKLNLQTIPSGSAAVAPLIKLLGVALLAMLLFSS